MICTTCGKIEYVTSGKFHLYSSILQLFYLVSFKSDQEILFIYVLRFEIVRNVQRTSFKKLTPLRTESLFYHNSYLVYMIYLHNKYTDKIQN